MPSTFLESKLCVQSKLTLLVLNALKLIVERTEGEVAEKNENVDCARVASLFLLARVADKTRLFSGEAYPMLKVSVLFRIMKSLSTPPPTAVA